MIDFLYALRWWLALMVIGLVALPFGRILFAPLPDKGYALLKPLGLLLATYLFWMGGTLGFLSNNGGGALFAVIAVAAVSLWFERRREGNSSKWLRENWRYVLSIELLFLLLFGVWVWVRMQNPTLQNTEKPMEIAFLNAIGRSNSFPPPDPWLSGFSISYYYFGYVMVALLAQLTAIPEMIAFNLAIPWVVATTAIGAFGLTYNLLRWREQFRQATAMVAGLTAALAIPLAGNLQVVLELLHSNGIGSERFWQWLNIENINGATVTTGFGTTGPRFWWWWRSSRLIREETLGGGAGLEPIHEFPAFSFILGDLHPHVMALPFALLALSIALVWFYRQAHLADNRLLFATTALIIGGLSFLNTWDVLIHWFVVVATYAVVRQQTAGKPLRDGALFGASLLVVSLGLYLPFYIGFSSQAGPPFILPTLVMPTRLPQFLVIFGMPLLAIVPFIVVAVWQSAEKRLIPALATTAVLWSALVAIMLLMVAIVGAAPGGNSVRDAATELGVSLREGQGVGAGVRHMLQIAFPLLTTRLSQPLTRLLLMLLIALCCAVLFTRNRSEDEAASTNGALPFVLLLVLTGALLAVGPEFLYLKDNFGQRMNTIFKFYYQAWLLFGIAAVFGVAWLGQQLRPLGAIVGVGYTVLLVGTLAFPVYGVAARSAEYGGTPTLNGLAHLSVSEQDGILWLRENGTADDIVLESVGGQYSAHARVSAHTGLSTLLGWAGHQYQWRGSTPEPAAREPVVAQIYEQTRWDGIPELLNAYDIDYIYVGQLERGQHGTDGINKFDENLDIAYQNAEVTIYAWQPQ